MPNHLTKDALKCIIKSNRELYLPYSDLVDILYLPNGGWDTLLNLTEFENLKVLYASGNRMCLFYVCM